MIIFAVPKYRRWWDTERCRQWPLSGFAAYLIAKRIAYVGHDDPANDRDHIRW